MSTHAETARNLLIGCKHQGNNTPTLNDLLRGTHVKGMDLALGLVDLMEEKKVKKHIIPGTTISRYELI